MEIKQYTESKIEEITKEIIKCLEINEKHTTYLNLESAEKAVLRGKLIAINAYIEKEERSQINNLTLCFEEQVEKLNPKLAKGRK